MKKRFLARGQAAESEVLHYDLSGIISHQF
jgi:hypothetical protein